MYVRLEVFIAPMKGIALSISAPNIQTLFNPRMFCVVGALSGTRSDYSDKSRENRKKKAEGFILLDTLVKLQSI